MSAPRIVGLTERWVSVDDMRTELRSFVAIETGSHERVYVADEVDEIINRLLQERERVCQKN
jgi:hypothetical protein